MALTFPEPIEWFNTETKDGKLYVNGLKLQALATSEVSGADVQAQFEKQAGRMAFDVSSPPDAPYPVAANTVTIPADGEAVFTIKLHDPILHTTYLEQYGGVDVTISVGSTQEKLSLSYEDAEALLGERGGTPPEPDVGEPAIVEVPVVTQAGDTITCTEGTWTNAPTSYAYQWRKDGADIGTGASSYVVTGADVGATVNCTVTATNDVGAVYATSNDVVVTSPIVADVAAAPQPGAAP